ncbi:ABC transporter substrate-binding protein [Clostridium grantii]|uniref:Spermidine/putrescine transport system substrate-binding protein n=1 Tax=Clostridium grantii DSM 8605 TaxID=1121316 RepID=A0A1M5T059_9CLOT|nr:spermidine/putrescine ABC transporter substrate-binding protein [Clostridium grantii]SHH44116.1 spermidine/putrescine transport system substrate-binding protein [Clostridium grantii DSM 8605]
MKKIVSLLMICLVTVSLLTGCGGSENTEAAGELNIYVWTEYVPQSVVDKFTEETGIKVNMSTFSSNEDMLSKVNAEAEGTYDIVQPTDYMVKLMIEQGLLEEVNKDKLTNLSNLSEAYLDATYDPGNVYSIPYQGGVVPIAVNTSKVDLDIKSYDDLFNPELKNSIVMLDDYRINIGIAAKSMGYSMSETDPDKLKEISDKLMMLKDNVKLYDSDSPKSALISGDCTVACCWSAEIALAMEENPDIKIVFPEEGSYMFMDNWAIPKGAKNYDEAMQFIDFMLDAENTQMVIEEFPYLNPNAAAVEAMGEEYIQNQAKNIPTEVIQKVEYIDNLDVDTLAIYDQMWTELKN